MKNHNKLVQIIENYMQNVPLRGKGFRTLADRADYLYPYAEFSSPYGEKVLKLIRFALLLKFKIPTFSSPYGE